MPEPLRHPLRLQIASRLALALLVTIATTVALGFWFHWHANQRSLEHHLQQATTHFNAALALRETEWERAAYNFKARLEYSRVLEDASGRQGKLGSFITAQGGVPEFPVVVVLDHEGNRLAWFAYLGEYIPSVAFDAGEGSWAYDARENRLYRVYRQQVWLGDGNNGVLLTFRPIDHALLGTLTYPETDLVTLWQGRPIASSSGDAGMTAAEALPGAGTKSTVTSWNPVQPDNPKVRLTVHPDEPFALRELFKPLAMGALAFAVAAWIVFGIWATALVRRILALGRAQREFAVTGHASPVVLASLNAAEPQRGDEVSELSASLLGLMGSVAEHRRAEEKATEILRQSEERYRFMVEGARLVAWEFSFQFGRFTYVSPQARGLLGRDPDEWLQPGFIDLLVHPDDAIRVGEAWSRAFATGTGCSLDYRLRHVDGYYVWVHHLSAATSGDDGDKAIERGILLDISERKLLEQRLATAGLVFEKATEGIMVTDARNRIISVNPAFETITGYTADEVLGKDPKLLNAGLQAADHYEAMWHALERDGFWAGEVWNRRKSGEPFAQRLTVSTIHDTEGRAQRYLAMFSDVTTQKRQAEKIEHQAAHDALTGLPNRRLLGDRIGQAIMRAQRHGQRVGVAMLDLDGFKHINDTLGHRIGDLLLVETARRLTHCIRESDTVARVGGDEFMVVLPEIQGQHDLQTLAGKILDHVREGYVIEGKDLFVSCSVGLTLFPDDGETPEILLAHADTAMYRAKADGKNTYRFFTAEMHEHAVARLHLEEELRRALRDGEFELYYQPVVRIFSGLAIKAEALVRWRHPQRGLVSPVQFVSAAEECGLMLPLGTWVVQEAARQAALWKEQAPADFRIGVNLSAQQFQRGDCVAVLRDALADAGADASQLVVEITESLFIDDQGDACRQLNELSAMGFQVAIDDFGTGYSSLSYLKRFPVDILKIDQTFVRGIPDDEENMALVDAIIAMSKGLRLDVIAEGIETEDQRNFLINRGCRFGQGYLFGRPVPAAEFARLYFTRTADEPPDAPVDTAT
jgi:diguanylate cyclase (GGDEF)-like protein/PAS domain S-box-containing protein